MCTSCARFLFYHFTVRITIWTISSSHTSVCPMLMKVKMAGMPFLHVTYLRLSSLFNGLFHFLCHVHLSSYHQYRLAG